MKFVDAKYSFRNPNKLDIGGLAKSVFGVVIDEGLGDAVLIGDDSMYGIDHSFIQNARMIMTAGQAISQQRLLALTAKSAG